MPVATMGSASFAISCSGIVLPQLRSRTGPVPMLGRLLTAFDTSRGNCFSHSVAVSNAECDGGSLLAGLDKSGQSYSGTHINMTHAPPRLISKYWTKFDAAARNAVKVEAL